MKLNDIQLATIQEASKLIENFDKDKQYTQHQQDILRYADTVQTLAYIGHQLLSSRQSLAQEGLQYKAKYESLMETIEIKLKETNQEEQKEVEDEKPKPKTRRKRKTTGKLSNVKLTDIADERVPVQEASSTEQHENGASTEESKEAQST